MLKPKSRSLVLLLVALGGSLWLHFALIDFAFDDAYIHFRIADHLATEGEPYYNLGEAVKGSSSTVWTLVLALTFRFTGVAVWPVAVLNSLVLVANGYVYGRLTSAGFPGRRALAIAAGGFAVAALVPASVGLMETGLAMLLVGLAWLLLTRSNPLGFSLAAVAVFTRPETAIFVLLVVGFALATKAFSLRAIALAGSLAALPFIAFDLLFFGTLIPHAAVAKSTVFPLTIEESLRLTRFPTTIFPSGTTRTVTAALYVVLGGLAVGLLLLELRKSETNRPHGWLLVSLAGAGTALVLATSSGELLCSRGTRRSTSSRQR